MYQNCCKKIGIIVICLLHFAIFASGIILVALGIYTNTHSKIAMIIGGIIIAIGNMIVGSFLAIKYIDANNYSSKKSNRLFSLLVGIPVFFVVGVTCILAGIFGYNDKDQSDSFVCAIYIIIGFLVMFSMVVATIITFLQIQNEQNNNRQENNRQEMLV